MNIDHNFYLAAELPIGEYIETSINPDIRLDGTQPFTIEAWIKINSLGSNSVIISKNDVMEFGITNEKIYIEIFGCPRIESNHIDKTLNTYEWHYVSVSYDTQRIYLYIDGTSVANGSFSGQGTENDNSIIIGNNLYGKIRSVLIYNRGISAHEVMNNMFNEPRTEGLVSYIDFTQSPPLDIKETSRKIILSTKTRIVKVHPAVILSGIAFMAPTRTHNINPGGSQIDTYTIQAFIRVNKQMGIQTIFANCLPNSDAGMSLFLEHDPTVNGMRIKSLRGINIKNNDILISKSYIKENTWVSIATVYNGRELSIYINGEKDSSADSYPILNYSIDSNPLIGGCQQNGHGAGYHTLQGNMSSLEIWNIALSDTKIKEYASKSPDYAEEGLVGCFDFTVSPIKNEVDDTPVSMCDGVVIRDIVSNAPTKTSEKKAIYNQAARYNISHNTLKSIRNTIDFEAMKQNHIDTLYKVSEKEIEELRYELNGIDSPAETDILLEAWEHFLLSGKLDIVVTDHVIEGDFVLIVHKPTYSYVAYKAPCHTIDSCVLMKIKLLFILLAGILSALFGLDPTLNNNAINFINNRILTIPEIATKLSVGTTMTAANVFSIGAILVRRGLLKELLKMLISVGFWFFLRLITKLVLTFLSIGGAVVIASLISTAALFSITYIDFIRLCFPFPPILIDYIKFNHDLAQNITSAMNIRRDLTHTVEIPEWTSARNEPVAYIRSQVGANLHIQVKFIIGSILIYRTQIRATAVGGNFLGNIPSFNCSFFLGSSSAMNIVLTNNQIATTPVGKYDVALNWEYYNPNITGWLPIGTTTHHISITQGTPVAPWGQAINLAAVWPWESALEVACGWANGATSNSEVIENITNSINISGISYIGAKTYNTRNGIGVHFHCTIFLNHLKTIGAATMRMECSDCAVISTIFSRLLGVNINELSIIGQEHNIQTTFIKVIGEHNWGQRTFIYHIISSLRDGNNIVNTDSIYDACIEVNSTTDPWPVAAPPAIQLGFIPGTTAHPMTISAHPLNTPVVETVPYNIQTSYIDRLLLNTIVDKTLKLDTYQAYTIL